MRTIKLFLISCLLIISSKTFGQQTSQLPPLNPDYIKYQNVLKKLQPQVAGGHSLGLIHTDLYINAYKKNNAPTIQTSNFSVTNLTDTTMTLNWTRGNGTGVIVVARNGSAVDTGPTDGTAYTADSVFASGQEIGTGNYVVYNDTGTIVDITGLSTGNYYYFAIYEYDSSDTSYLTPPLTGNAVSKFTIKKTTTPPKIDGISDSNDPWTGEWIPLTASRPTNTTFDMSAEFQMAYDDSDLFVIARVNDPTPGDTATSSTYQSDCVELCIASDTTSGVTGHYKIGDFQLRKVWGRPLPEGLDGERGTGLGSSGFDDDLTVFKADSNFKIVEVDSSVFYVQEWKIPWADLTNEMDPSWDGKEFKFDIQASDNTTNTDDGRTQQQYWNSNTDEQWRNTNYLGLVFLETPFVFNDAGVIAIIEPHTAAWIDSHDVKTIIRNFGNTPLTSATINWSVNDSVQIPYYWTESLPPFAIDTVTLGEYNFSTLGGYNVVASTSLPNGVSDVNPANDLCSGTIAIVEILNTFPWSEDFESVDSQYIGLITQTQAGLIVTNEDGNLGNALKFSGGDLFEGWTDSSDIVTPTNAWIDNITHQATATIFVDATGVIGQLIMSFDLKQRFTDYLSADCCWFRVLVNGIQIPDINDTLNFKPVTSSSDPFTNHIFDLSTYIGDTIKIQLQSSCRLGASWGDMSFVDNLKIQITSPNDAGVIAFTEPLSSTSTGPCAVKTIIRNFGNTNLTSSTINWSVNDSVQTPFSWIGTIEPFTNDTVTIGDYDFTTPGEYNIVASTSLPNGETDGDTTNDSCFSKPITIIGIISSFPWIEDFEVVDSQYIGLTTQTQAGLSVAPEGGNPDPALKFIGGDIFEGWTDSSYIVTPTNAWVDNFKHQATATIYVDGTGVAGGLIMSFDLNQKYSISADNSWFRVLVNGTQISDVNDTSNFNPTFSNVDLFSNHMFDLSTYISDTIMIQLQSSCRSENDFSYVDNLIIQKIFPNDAGAIAFTEPLSSTSTGPCAVKTIIRNFGNTNLTSTTINWSVNESVQTPYSWIGTLEPFTTDTVTIGDYDFTTPGEYNIVASTSLPNGETDGDPTNDSCFSKSITIIGIISSFPWTEGFEGSKSQYIGLTTQTQAGLSVAPEDGNPDHALKFTGSDIFGGWSEVTATEAWDKNITHQSTATIFVDATGVIGQLIMSFDLRQRYTDFLSASCWFRVLVNGIQIPDINDTLNFKPVTSSSDPFANHIFDLSAYVGDTIKIQLQSSCRLGDNFGDMSFVDNLKIQITSPNDAGVISITEPLSASCIGLYPVKAVLRNYGNSPLTSAIIDWSVNDSAQTPFSWFGTLEPFTNDTVTIGDYDFTTPGEYNIVASTSLPNGETDGDPTNDSCFSNPITIIGIISSFPWTEDFEGVDSQYIGLTTQTQSGLIVTNEDGNPGYALKFIGGDLFEGWTGNSGIVTPTNAWVDNTLHQATATIYVDGTGVTEGLIMSFDLKQKYSLSTDNSWFRVLMNGTQIPDIDGKSNFNPTTQFEDPFTKHIFDLSAYIGDTFTIQLQSSCRVSSLDASYVDNLEITSETSIPDELSVADTTISNTESACFNAYDTITVAGTDPVVFEDGSLVNLIAGVSIFLLPGFHSQSGSYLHALITTDSTFCDDASGSIVYQPVEKSLEEESLPEKQAIVKGEKSVKVYPNPNNGQFTLELTNFESGAMVCIYNILGARVYQSKATNQDIHKVNLPYIKRGIYFVKVMDGKEQFTRKMVVN